MRVSLLQEVGEVGGTCRNFEAVPGYGLKCSVSGLEAYTDPPSEWKYSKVISRMECVQTRRGFDLMVRDIEMGAGTRTYQVRDAHAFAK